MNANADIDCGAIAQNGRNTIRLTLEGDTWFSTFEGDHAADVQRLFGTTRIPTAFTVKSNAEQVSREIKSRNRGCRVVVGMGADERDCA